MTTAVYQILAILIGSILGAKLAVIIHDWENKNRR